MLPTENTHLPNQLLNSVINLRKKQNNKKQNVQSYLRPWRSFFKFVFACGQNGVITAACDCWEIKQVVESNSSKLILVWCTRTGMGGKKTLSQIRSQRIVENLLTSVNSWIAPKCAVLYLTNITTTCTFLMGMFWYQVWGKAMDSKLKERQMDGVPDIYLFIHESGPLHKWP